MEDERDTTSLRQRIKKSSMSLSCCFNTHRFEGFESTSDEKMMSPMRSPEIRGKCRNLMSRMGRHRRHSGDFSYDPLSYALNFEEDADFALRNFSSRLPISPPRDIPEMRSVSPPPARADRPMSIDEQMPIGRSVSPPKSRAATSRSVTPATAVLSRGEIVAFS